MSTNLKELPLKELERRYEEKKAWLNARLSQYETAAGPDWDELFELRKEIDRRKGETNPTVNVNFADYLTE